MRKPLPLSCIALGLLPTLKWDAAALSEIFGDRACRVGRAAAHDRLNRRGIVPTAQIQLPYHHDLLY
jgi:hypothetical protein